MFLGILIYILIFCSVMEREFGVVVIGGEVEVSEMIHLNQA